MEKFRGKSKKGSVLSKILITIAVIFIVIVILVAYWLYKKRKNEDTGKFLIYDL